MKVSKNIKKLLNNNEIVNNILLESRRIDDVYEQFGYILSYTIASRSKIAPTIKGRNPNDLLLEPTIAKLSDKQLKRNVIDNGFVTHSFNGYNLKKIKKYGLGSHKIIDKELKKDFDELCFVLGEGEYTNNQGGGTDEIYYTTPGAKTFHYACGYSPERLWLGPLKQNRENALPIKVGETKKDYALRVLKAKIDLLDVNDEEKKNILKTGKKVIDKLCAYKPVVALIPIKSKKYSLLAHHATTKLLLDKKQTLLDLLKKGTGTYSTENPVTMFTENTNNIEFNNLGNLVHTGNIPASELEFFEVEDVFSLIQQRAKLKGFEIGDEINYYTGNKNVEPKAVQSVNVTSKELIKSQKNAQTQNKERLL